VPVVCNSTSRVKERTSNGAVDERRVREPEPVLAEAEDDVKKSEQAVTV